MSKLENFRKEIEYCTYCPKMCRFSCPVAEAENRETVTPTAKMTLLHLLNMGALEWSPEVVEPLYHCTGCLISRTFCEHNIEVFEPFVAAREEIIKRGAAPEAIAQQDKVMAEFRNPYGKNLGKQLDGFVPTKYVKRDADVLFFVGCITTVFYEKHVTAAIKLLEALGVDFGIYVDDKNHCCGYPSYSIGHRARFEEIAGIVSKNLSGAKKILTLCPTCANTLKTVYANNGFKPDAEVVHFAPFIHKYFKEGKIGFEKKYGRVAYHDPCHLGRHAGIYDEPRELLKAAVAEIVEFPWKREESACCGGGGGLLLTASDVAMKIARKRTDFLKKAKPDFAASACPTCDKMLQRAWDKNKVLDLVMILKESMVKT